MQNNRLPKNVFIANGIGITPFRSMIQYLIDSHNSAPILLFYRAKMREEFLFQDIFEKAKKQLRFQIVYVLSDVQSDWKGETGQINEALIRKYIPDVAKPVYYLSGPQAMVESYRVILEKMEIRSSNIKTDLFTGYEKN